MSKTGVICRIESDRYTFLVSRARLLCAGAGLRRQGFRQLCPSDSSPAAWVAVAAAAAVAVLATSTLISFPGRANTVRY